MPHFAVSHERSMRGHPTPAAVGAGVFFAVVCTLYVATVMRDAVLSGDPAQYVGLADALASGQGYTFNGRSHTLYPPGFPAILAPLAAVFGPNVLVMQVWVAVLAVGAVVSVWVYLRERGTQYALVFAACFAIAAPFYSLATGGIRSEPAYIAISFLALAGIDRLVDGRSRHVPLLASALFFLVFAAVMVRTVGIALAAALAASAIHVAIRRGTRDAPARVLPYVAGCVGGFAAAAAWLTWLSRHSLERTYVSLLTLEDPQAPDAGGVGLAGLAARVVGSLRIQGTHAAELLTGVGWLKPMWSSPVLLAALVLILFGLGVELRRRNPLAAWYALAYVGILALWPFDEGKRFLVPVLPLLLLFAARGAAMLIRSVDRDPAAFGKLTMAVASVGVTAWLVENAGSGSWSRQVQAAGFGWLLVAGLGGVAWARGALVVSRLRLPVVVVAFLAAYSMLNAASITGMARRNLTSVAPTAGDLIRDALPWIVTSTQSSAVVMSDFGTGIHFHTGRPTVPLPKTADASVLLDAIATERPVFIVVADFPDHPYYRPTAAERLEIIRAHLGPDRVELAFDYGAGRIYRVRHGDR